MKSKQSLLICAVLVFCSSAFTQGADETSNLRISSPEEIKSEFDSVPCKNGDRLKSVQALFERMGAKPEEIAVEKVGGIENVVIRKVSANGSSEKIVIGAHYDKTPDGCGAIDNWTGIVSLAHIYRSVKDLPLKKNIHFVAFGEEEKGLVGSSKMVGAIKKEQVVEYCAMINIDSLGIGIPQTLDNISSKKLIDFTGALAKEMNVPFSHARVDGASSDSASFIKKKIPAVTIHALNNDWRKILHSSNDHPTKVNHESVYVGYRVALALLVRVDDAECQAFREDKEKK
ncbi:MAG TPA: M20/M25/M40 family metallo-hydrolase [Blastocatellia bacterium]|nr:M20/M25/M40 family metallo-hydrolase [Blastocatellia bacterium]